MKRKLLKQQYIALIEANVEFCQNMTMLQAGAKGCITHIIRKLDDIEGAEFVSEGVKNLIAEKGYTPTDLLTHGHTTQSAKHAQAGLLTDLIGKKRTQFEHAVPAGQITDKLLAGESFYDITFDCPKIWVTNEEHLLLNKVDRGLYWKDAYAAAGIKIYS